MKTLTDLRSEITQIDEDLLLLFHKRFSLVAKVGEYKKLNNLPVQDKAREAQVLTTLTEKGQKLDLSKDFITSVWQAIFQESYRVEQ